MTLNIECEFSECGRKTLAVGLCATHYNQRRAGEELKPIARRIRRDPNAAAKICSRCSLLKPLSEFLNGSSRDPIYSQCKGCKLGIPRERKSHLFRLYKMTKEGWEQTLRDQNGRCLVCETDDPINGWHVDHDHACCPGKKTCGNCIRGILCGRCNSKLGWFEIHEERIFQYLSKNEAVNARVHR